MKNRDIEKEKISDKRFLHKNLIFHLYFDFTDVCYHFRWILVTGPTLRRSLKLLRRTSTIGTMKSGVIGAVVYWEANPQRG